MLGSDIEKICRASIIIILRRPLLSRPCPANESTIHTEATPGQSLRHVADLLLLRIRYEYLQGDGDATSCLLGIGRGRRNDELGGTRVAPSSPTAGLAEADLLAQGLVPWGWQRVLCDSDGEVLFHGRVDNELQDRALGPEERFEGLKAAQLGVRGLDLDDVRGDVGHVHERVDPDIGSDGLRGRSICRGP